MAWKDNKERPSFVTKKKAHEWQKFVDKLIRRFITQGDSQLVAVDKALDARDAHIKSGHKLTKSGKIIK